MLPGPVCLEQLDADSRVLPCQHTFCKRCLQGIVETHKELRCPECRIVVTTEVCDLPTNILLIRLLDGLKKNPKFVPRNTRSHRSHSRPAFRIAKEIFFQSASPPSPPQTVHHVRRSAEPARSYFYSPDQRPLNFSISNCGTRSDCTPGAANTSVCYAVPIRRTDQSSSCRPPRVVPPAEPLVTPASCATSTLLMSPVSSSINLCDPIASQAATSNSFCRSSSHDYLAGVQQLCGWTPAPVLSSSTRTKSLSRPSSRKSEKHATLPPRISISPNQLQSFARSMSHGLSQAVHAEAPKSLSTYSMTIGNPLYGFTTERQTAEQKRGTTAKPAILISETRLRALEPTYFSTSGRRVRALFTCVGETVSELSFDADAIITNGNFSL